jgi:hypothetical protein
VNDALISTDSEYGSYNTTTTVHVGYVNGTLQDIVSVATTNSTMYTSEAGDFVTIFVEIQFTPQVRNPPLS